MGLRRQYRLRCRGLLVAMLVSSAAGLAGVHQGAQAASDCATSLTISQQVSNTAVSIFGGRAWGETFRTADTLVRSITVWRLALPDTDYINFRLFITRVDPTGRPIPW